MSVPECIAPPSYLPKNLALPSTFVSVAPRPCLMPLSSNGPSYTSISRAYVIRPYTGDPVSASTLPLKRSPLG